jgi:hypothetical protein
MSKSNASTSKRGAYGVIYRAILASRKFSALSPSGKLAFYTLKLRLGFAQIDRMGSWPIELADLTGLSVAEATAAIKELCAAKIARFDGKVLWIVDGLRWDPSMAGNVSPTVAQGIERHVAGLPTCRITDAFRRHYPSIFGLPVAPVAPVVPAAIPLPPTPPKSGKRKALVGVGVGVGDEVGDATCSTVAVSSTWPALVVAMWEKHTSGVLQFGPTGRQLKPLVEKHGEAVVVAALERYLLQQEPTYRTLNNFSSNFGRWLDASATARTNGPRVGPLDDPLVSADEFMAEVSAGRVMLEDAAHV